MNGWEQLTGEMPVRAPKFELLEDPPKPKPIKVRKKESTAEACVKTLALLADGVERSAVAIGQVIGRNSHQMARVMCTLSIRGQVMRVMARPVRWRLP